MVFNKHNEDTSDSVKRAPLKTIFIAIAGLLIFFFTLLLISVITLRWVNPSFTAFTLREDWSAYEAEKYNLRNYWTVSDEIPEHLIWAVIASEDQRFWDHWGFDFNAIEEALEERRRGVRQRGASTITQQVAKNLFLSPAETFFRKGIEAGITLLIEIIWPKERIIEVYVNIAEFGPGVFGIGYAASEFFDKSPGSLTPDESARLAAVLPNPKRMRVEPPSPYAEERSLWILRQMGQLTGASYLPDKQNGGQTIEADTLSINNELQHTTDTVTVQEDTLIWDDIPDTLLQSNW